MNKGLILAAAALVSTAALAQAPSSVMSPNTSKADPNERICRIVEVIGSRLNRSRICMTRAEWEEHRRETQQNAERTQMRRSPTQY